MRRILGVATVELPLLHNGTEKLAGDHTGRGQVRDGGLVASVEVDGEVLLYAYTK